MFLCAQARPRFDPQTRTYWDGKIGIWPVGEWKAAERSSARRPAGTIVWVDTSITRDVYRQILLYKVVPAIQDKWPRYQWDRADFQVRIQQDGAGSHIFPQDDLFKLQLRVMGLEDRVTLYTQPPNSPDMNINDLGFFRALQSAYFRRTPADDASALITNVINTYNDYDPKKINRIFLSLMQVFNEVVKCGGNNTYKLPHMGKEALERRDALPHTLPVVREALQPYIPNLSDDEEEDNNNN